MPPAELLGPFKNLREPLPTKLALRRQKRLPERRFALGGFRAERPSDGVGEAGGVDGKVWVDAVREPLERQKRSTEEDDVGRCLEFVLAAERPQPWCERPKPLGPVILADECELERLREILNLRRLRGAILEPSLEPFVRDDSNLLEVVAEGAPVPCEDVADAARKSLHDVLLDASHEPEIEEAELAILGVEEVALVRVGVDEPCADELCDGGVHRHRDHVHLLRALERAERLSLDPLHRQNARRSSRAGVLGVKLWGAHKPEKGVLARKLFGVRRFQVVVHLLEDATPNLVGDLPEVERALPHAPHELERELQDVEILRHERENVGALHFDGELHSLVRDGSVHLTERRRCDGLGRDFPKQKRRRRRRQIPLTILLLSSSSSLFSLFSLLLPVPQPLQQQRGCDVAVPAEVLTNDGPRVRAVKRSVLHLQRPERLRRLRAHEVRALRERLPALDKDGAEAREDVAQALAARALLGREPLLALPHAPHLERGGGDGEHPLRHDPWARAEKTAHRFGVVLAAQLVIRPI
mmetsp:Transcript_921/g.3453  ORF Transcript_921/g.3453 Transcript_921/m.3453 type:complete len:528 (+) Transcript_921:1250-2833(+)